MRWRRLYVIRALLRLGIAGLIWYAMVWFGTSLQNAYYPPRAEVLAGEIIYWASYVAFGLMLLLLVFSTPRDWLYPARLFPDDWFRQRARRDLAQSRRRWHQSMAAQLKVYRAVKSLRRDQGNDKPTVLVDDGTIVKCHWPDTGTKVWGFIRWVLVGTVGQGGARITIEHKASAAQLESILKLRLWFWGGAALWSGDQVTDNPDEADLRHVLELLQGKAGEGSARVVHIDRLRPDGRS